jgi:hypothetical protein
MKNQKSFQAGIGHDKDKNKSGIIGFKYETTWVKDYIRGWLEQNG